MPCFSVPNGPRQFPFEPVESDARPAKAGVDFHSESTSTFTLFPNVGASLPQLSSKHPIYRS